MINAHIQVSCTSVGKCFFFFLNCEFDMKCVYGKVFNDACSLHESTHQVQINCRSDCWSFETACNNATLKHWNNVAPGPSKSLQRFSPTHCSHQLYPMALKSASHWFSDRFILINDLTCNARRRSLIGCSLMCKQNTWLSFYDAIKLTANFQHVLTW